MNQEKNRPNVLAIIQARMGSSRLPGKVLKDICGVPMLEWVSTRAAMAEGVDKVVIATTENERDDPIEEFCNSKGIACFRGAEFDVLDRFYHAAEKYNMDIIVRLTADCPLLDPGLIDEVIEKLLSTGADFAANRLPPPYRRTYPIGLDVEAVRFAALKTAWKRAKKLYEREHVLPYIYNPDNSFRVEIVDGERDLGNLRWTVDTELDLVFVRKVAEKLGCSFKFTWEDVLDILESHPDLEKININVPHKSYNDVDERLGNE